MRVVVLGLPGAGKGTQARLLSTHTGVPRLSTGDALREAMAAGTDAGRAARDYVERGDLVPDDLMIGVVREGLSRPEYQGGFVLDGFPRTGAQAEALEEFLQAQGQALDAVLWVEVPEEEAVRRLAGRWVCPRCGAPYHLERQPPQRPGRCDRCGAALAKREDDREEAVRRRLRAYRNETQPLIALYDRKGLLVRVKGDLPPEAVHARSVELLEMRSARDGRH